MLAKFDFLRDVSGSPTDKGVTRWYKTTPETRQHQYDTLDRLTHIDYGTDPPDPNEDFDMDLLSNRTSYEARDASVTTYTSDVANQYTALVPQVQSPTYDSAGNMTADPHGYVFGYDHENRLRKEEKAGSPNVLLAAFRYDALGRRVEMVDESVTPAVMTRYVYDGDNVVAAYEDVGGTWIRQRYYVHGSTYIDERAVVHDDGADRDYYTVLDDLYTVPGLVDEVGNVFESYDMDAYGTPTMIAHTFSDFDGDGDVDPSDFLTFSNCMNGSLNPPKPGCPISRPNECGGQSATGGDARVVGRRGGRPARRSQVFGR